MIKGTPVAVELVVAKVAGGMASEDVMTEYDLKREDVLAVLDDAAKLVAQEEVEAV